MTFSNNRIVDALKATSPQERYSRLDDLELDVSEDGLLLTGDEEEALVDALGQDDLRDLAGPLWQILETLEPNGSLKDLALSVLNSKRADRPGAAAYLNAVFPSEFGEIAPKLLEDRNLYVQYEAALNRLLDDPGPARAVLERLKVTAPDDLAQRAGLVLYEATPKQTRKESK